MIEDLFPKTVDNILDYDAIKLAAKQYVEDVFVNIVQEFADNMTLYTMDSAHLADVAGHVAGDSSLSLEQLLDYINSENVYHECDFVSELLSEFPEGVEYKEFDVTGYGFPPSDLFPFNNVNRSYNKDGTPTAVEDQDTIWTSNAQGDLPERNLLMSRYKGQFNENHEPNWHRKEGRRSSWGNPETWITSGGFGKPATIHINVDEERTVIEENGLTAVENWLGTVSHKLPINLYIEINSTFVTRSNDSTFEGYYMSFPYEEEEGFCTNDPEMAIYMPEPTPPGPEPPGPTPTTLRAYFTVNGESQPFETTVGYNAPVFLYDKNGQTITFDINKLYKILSVHNLNGDSLDWNPTDYIYYYFGELMWYAQANPEPYDALYLEYEEIEPDGIIGYLNSSSGRNGETVGYNSFADLYDINLQKIVYDSSKTYSIEKVYDINCNELEFDANDFLYDNGYMLWYSNVLPATGSPYWARCIIIKVEE